MGDQLRLVVPATAVPAVGVVIAVLNRGQRRVFPLCGFRCRNGSLGLTLILGERALVGAGTTDSGASGNAACGLYARSAMWCRCSRVMTEIPREEKIKTKNCTARTVKMEAQDWKKVVRQGMVDAPLVNERDGILRSVIPNEVRALWRGRQGSRSCSLPLSVSAGSAFSLPCRLVSIALAATNSQPSVRNQ